MKIKKILRTVAIVLLSVVLAVLLVLQVGVTVRYWHFFTNSKIAFLVPGLTDNFVPQGFEYLPEGDGYLISGYMSDGTASRVYIRNGKGDTAYGTLLNKDGTPYTGHAGGICVNGAYAYLPGDTGVDVFMLRDILTGEARCLGTIVMGYRVDFCSFSNGYLLVGNFEYGGHYETPEYQHLTTPAGDHNTGLITIFKADDKSVFSIDPNAVAALSIREKVQGVCITDDGRIVLSTSWGLSDSKLYIYDLKTENPGVIAALSGPMPLYYLDSASLVKTVTAPPMAEEMVFQDGRILVLNESSCNKYFYGRLIRGSWVYAYNVDAE